MAKLLEGKVAIVTGAGRGIGRAEALLLANKGAMVVVNDAGVHFDGTGKASGPADEVVNEIKAKGGKAVANYESVSDFQGAKRIIDAAISNFGKLNILVNNAGILRDRMFFNMSEQEWDEVIAVHLKGTFNCARHACGYWRDEHKAGRIHYGKIINTTSDAGLLGNLAQANYGAAKAAIAAFSLIVSREMKRYDVTSNCVAPNARTRMTTDASPAGAAVMGEAPPPGQWDPMSPDHVARLAAYLASDDAKDITGEVFRVVADTVWLLQGWHSINKVSKNKKDWTPEELGPAIKKMVEKAPPKPEIASVFQEAGLI
ncbi:MAG: hypothetical protein A2Z75_06455 [Chloroflexi bacterium RBG_13_50_10]|nr:MAG: hypothetical protein A2Z75_06455 [Chloroflexi bacterium RBG_13_50_10]